jgi:hypothetical protein
MMSSYGCEYVYLGETPREGVSGISQRCRSHSDNPCTNMLAHLLELGIIYYRGLDVGNTFTEWNVYVRLYEGGCRVRTSYIPVDLRYTWLQGARFAAETRARLSCLPPSLTWPRVSCFSCSPQSTAFACDATQSLSTSSASMSRLLENDNEGLYRRRSLL